MPLAGGPLSADNCGFRDCGRGDGALAGVARLTTGGGRGVVLAGSGDTRLVAAGF